MSKPKKPKPADAIFPQLRKPLLPPKATGVGSGVGDLGGKLRPAGEDRSDHGKYVRQTFQLPHDHGWKAAPGHKVFVANRGDVRFEFPQAFVITHGEDAIKFHDAPPPDDACRISLTIWPLPPEVGLRMMNELHLPDLLRDATRDGIEHIVEKPGPVTHGKRLNYEYGWLQYAWNDEESGRVVQARTLMARTARVNLLITFEFYQDRREDYEPTFDHLMDTLRLSEPVTMTMRQGLN